jgi:Mg-chelatase subunit ChlD
MKVTRKIRVLILCSIALYCFGCRQEKAQEIQPAERVEMLVQGENDPRPYFHAELKFADSSKVKLPVRADELQKRIKVREAGSLFVREGKDFIPFKVSNRSIEGKLDLMLLFDLSGSMITGNLGSRTRLEAAKDAGMVLLNNFRPGDRIAIAPFESHDVKAKIENAPFVENREDAQAQIENLEARRDGNTALYSATIFALERLQRLKKTDRQYMLVILTDGKNDLRPGDDPELLRRKDDLDSVIRKLRETNIQTFTIGVGDGADADALKEMVYPRENKGQYTSATDTESLGKFLASAKQSLTEQIGILFYLRHRDYHTLQSLNLKVRIETLDGQILQGFIPWNCRAAAGCTPDKNLAPEEVRLLTDRSDAPQPPGAQWKELLWLLFKFAIAMGILAALWYGIPKLVWPVPSLPHIPLRQGMKLPPSRSQPRPRISPSKPGNGGDRGSVKDVARPRQGFEETRIYKNRMKDEG